MQRTMHPRHWGGGGGGVEPSPPQLRQCDVEVRHAHFEARHAMQPCGGALGLGRFRGRCGGAEKGGAEERRGEAVQGGAERATESSREGATCS